MAEVGSGRVISLERVTTGVGWATGAETKKLNSLGTSSRPSWLGLSVSTALLSNTGISTLEMPNYYSADSLLGKLYLYYNITRNVFHQPNYEVAVEETKQWRNFPAFFNGTWQQTTTALAHNPEVLGARHSA